MDANAVIFFILFSLATTMFSFQQLRKDNNFEQFVVVLSIIEDKSSSLSIFSNIKCLFTGSIVQI